MANEHSVVLGYTNSNEPYELAMDSSSRSRKREGDDYLEGSTGRIPINQFNAIIEAAKLDSFPMSAYASELSNALNEAIINTCITRNTV